jgi:rRNA maturation RNase YbeY
MRDLNSRGRGISETTDVLTFPAPAFPEAPLGEIVISVDYAVRQAQARGIPLQDELCYLGIHGALHLLGFDDEASEDRDRMFSEMHRIGRELDLPEQREWASILHGEEVGR